MQCPECNSSTRVARTIVSPQKRQVERRRVCLLDPTHRFTTIEKSPPPSLSTVAVRQTGSGQIDSGPFNRERLARDISAALMARRDISAEEVADKVATRVVYVLKHNLDSYLKPLTDDESDRFPNFQGAILDLDISTIVENEMDRIGLRMGRVLFALSAYGRQDRDNREGWSSAGDVLGWIHSRFPRVATEIPRTGGSPAVYYWTPPRRISHPTFVVKKVQRGDQPARFDPEQFVASIRKALVGRTGADEKCRSVADWVLRGIEGQATVHSAQLAAGVLECLRRVDDIAYLRWATVLKRIQNVRQFADEAKELIESPSSRLIFRAEQEGDVDRFATLD